MRRGPCPATAPPLGTSSSTSRNGRLNIGLWPPRRSSQRSLFKKEGGKKEYGAPPAGGNGCQQVETQKLALESANGKCGGGKGEAAERKKFLVGGGVGGGGVWVGFGGLGGFWGGWGFGGGGVVGFFFGGFAPIKSRTKQNKLERGERLAHLPRKCSFGGCSTGTKSERGRPSAK